mgnify:CR=1 FL=1
MRLIKDTVKLSNKIITSKSLSHNAVLAYTGLRMLMLRDSDDEVLLDLLESNIRRRGEIGGSAKKVGKRIKELERLYGIREGSAGGNGSNQYVKKELEPNSSVEAKNLSVTSQHKWEFQLTLFKTINFFQK